MRRWFHLRRPPTWLVVLLTTLSIVGGSTAAAAYAYDRATTDHVLPGVHIAGIDVSGMNRAQAIRAIRGRAESALARRDSFTSGPAPRNSFHTKTPQIAETIVAPWPSA